MSFFGDVKNVISHDHAYKRVMNNRFSTYTPYGAEKMLDMFPDMATCSEDELLWRCSEWQEIHCSELPKMFNDHSLDLFCDGNPRPYSDVIIEILANHGAKAYYLGNENFLIYH